MSVTKIKLGLTARKQLPHARKPFIVAKEPTANALYKNSDSIAIFCTDRMLVLLTSYL